MKKLYNKSHKVTDPGEQKDRNYHWNFDKTTHVFGKYEPMEFEGTKKSLRNDFLESYYPKTKIVDKRLEDFRQAIIEQVGKPKFRGSMPSNIDESHAFGAKSVIEGNWNAGKCINGDPQQTTDKLMCCDIDLGKNVLYRSKLKNMKPKTPSPEKLFGLPTIRLDLQKPENISLNDNNV